MRCLLLFLLGVVFHPTTTQAQRHIKNLNAIGVLAGATDAGRAVELSYGRFTSDRSVLRFGILGERGNRPSGRYTVGQFSTHLAPQLFKIGETLYMHALLGGVARYESGGEDRPEAAGKRPQRFAGGPELGVEADLFLLNRLSLVGSARKGYLFNKPLVDEWPGTYVVGLRWFVQ